MSENLPAPLVPPEVDLRGIPIPTAAFIQLAMKTFGMSYAEARKLVLGICRERGIPHEQIGEG